MGEAARYEDKAGRGMECEGPSTPARPGANSKLAGMILAWLDACSDPPRSRLRDTTGVLQQLHSIQGHVRPMLLAQASRTEQALTIVPPLWPSRRACCQQMAVLG